MENIRNLLLYGSFTKAEFDSISADSDDQNFESLHAYSTITAIVFGLETIVSFLTDTFASVNVAVYLACFLISMVLALATRARESSSTLSRTLKFVFIAMIYLYAITLSMIHPDKPSVTFMVVMVVVPLLFSGKPLWMIVVTALAMAINVDCAYFCKYPEWFVSELWNTVSFGAVAMIVGTLIIRMRLSNLLQIRKIAELSESDLLTGLRNRNSYEQNLSLYENMKAEELTCIYADVNGLHEVNNTLGHHAGDEMLKTVASEILGQFEREHSYRIGGDEFVVFALSTSEKNVREKIALIDQACQAKNYYVSFGYAVGQDDEDDLNALVKTAETRMYQAKSAYYKSRGIDRRCR